MSSPAMPDGDTRADQTVRALIAPAFVLVAVWLFATRSNIDAPRAPTATVAREAISTDPLRRPLVDPPWIPAGGYRLRCMECHAIRPPPERERYPLMQHRHVVLDHGMNDRCLNCHHPIDRNKLTLANGDPVAFADVPRVCAGCHGTVYRDWQKHTHGRTDGYWDATRGPQRQLSCVDCHDPHAPAYDLMRALPGPNTLRMGTPRAGGHDTHESADPLRRREAH